MRCDGPTDRYRAPCGMELREAVDLVYGLADSFPAGSEVRTALRMVARACERGQRLTSTTLPAVSSAMLSIVQARALLAMALEGGGEAAAAQEAHDLLANALGLVEAKILSITPRDDDPEED